MRPKINFRIIRGNTLLFCAALVWGITFVAQRVGMEHLGPLAYTAARFSLASLFLIPLAWACRRTQPLRAAGIKGQVAGILAAGSAMFLGINLQQMGLVTTTAGNAGFITGLYVVIVPLMGLLWRSKTGLGVWMGVILGAMGLYFLSVTSEIQLTPGDGWVLACAFLWAVHVWVLGYFSPRMNSVKLAAGQTAVCAAFSWIAAGIIGESVTLAALKAALGPILWGGFMSAGLGFTLQVIGQKDSPPAHAAVILSLETVVAAVSGWILLNEIMTSRQIFGAGLMLAGMLAAQLWALRGRRERRAADAARNAGLLAAGKT